MDIQRKISIGGHGGRIAWAALCAMLLFGASSGAAQRNVRRLALPVKGAAPVAARLLAVHNRERGALGAPPLTWDEALEGDARRWAQELARSGRFDHAKQDDQGENITMGTRGGYTPEDMVRGWIAERTLYKRGRFPDVSRTGTWSDVGHYTQLIWGTTRRMGCAIASNARHDYLVCRYHPPGNWMGEDPQNPVQRADGIP